MTDVPRMIPARTDVCYGWAYEPCGAPAVVAAYMEWPGQRWEFHTFCAAHAVAYLKGTSSLYDPPSRVIWGETVDAINDLRAR